MWFTVGCLGVRECRLNLGSSAMNKRGSRDDGQLLVVHRQNSDCLSTREGSSKRWMHAVHQNVQVRWLRKLHSLSYGDTHLPSTWKPTLYSAATSTWMGVSQRVTTGCTEWHCDAWIAVTIRLLVGGLLLFAQPPLFWCCLVAQHCHNK